MVRNNLQDEYFQNKNIAFELKQLNVDPSELEIPADAFDVVSLPYDEYLRLPSDIKYKFISTEDQIHQLKPLIGQKYIGCDSEWRPQIC